MTLPRVPIAAAVGVVLGAIVSSCFQAPSFFGPYACVTTDSCGGVDFICSDGICCQPRGEPLCLTYAFPDGSCADGGTSETYYEDLDEDGYGNANNPRRYCAAPSYDKVSTNAGDCNDNPAAGGALSYPGAEEQCDGQDNDCDETIDEGRPLQPFYRDLDSDTFGDPAATVMACKAPDGYVGNALDCQPADKGEHPGAAETCDGEDNNCDGNTDENAVGVGADCSPALSGTTPLVGACAAGKTVCGMGKLSCGQTVNPAPDFCDGIDNDCDGSTDEAPDCGGPPNIIPANPEVEVGAVNVGTATGGTPSNCIGDLMGTTAETATRVASPLSINWSGTNSNSHSLFVRPPVGKYWDLTKPGLKLRFISSISITPAATPMWKPNNQPLFMFCGPKGYVRLVFDGTPQAPTFPTPYLLSTPGGTTHPGPKISYNVVINSPATGTGAPNTWVAKPYPTGTSLQDILKQVNRIDVVIEPNSVNQTFTFTVDTFELQ